MMKIVVINLVMLLIPILGFSSPTKPPTIQEIFQRVDNPYERSTTIRFKVERSLERGLQSQQEKWEVFMQKPDAIRVEYEGPPKRIVLSHGNQYSEYIPQAHKALELDVSRMTDKAKEEMFAALMPRVAIPGFRLGIGEDIHKKMDFRVERMEEFNGRPSFYILGKDRIKGVGKKQGQSGSMRIWIDRERYTLLRLEVYDGSRFVSSIENQAALEIAPGQWFPGRVVVQNNTPSVLEKATYRISKMVVNNAIAPEFFQPHYDSNTQVTRP